MFLRTERLFLRPAWLEDAPGLARAIGHEAVACMLARVPWPYHEDHARAWIARPKDARLPALLITLPIEGGRIIGGVGLQGGEGGVEVGYWVDPAYWSRGYATEAVKGLLSLARLAGHRRIVARHVLENVASGKVLHKAGFRSTGRTRAFHSLARRAAVECVELEIDFSEAAAPCANVPRAARSARPEADRVAA